MSRCDEVKSVGGAAVGRGALSMKSAAPGHIGTGRKEGRGRADMVVWIVGCLVGDETGVRFGVEVVCWPSSPGADIMAGNASTAIPVAC